MSALDEAIELVLAVEGAPVGRTKLVKLLFLCDLEATRRGLPSITSGRWRYDHFGPFTWEVIDAAEALAHAGRICREYWEDDEWDRSGVDYQAPSAPAATPSLGANRQPIVRALAERWRGQSASRLKQHVYSLAVVRSNEPGEVFDMADPAWRGELAFYDALDAEKRADDALMQRLVGRHGG